MAEVGRYLEVPSDQDNRVNCYLSSSALCQLVYNFRLTPDKHVCNMNWLKNNHATVITAAIFCLGFVIFLYASYSPFVSYDAYWHLKMGEDLLTKGLSPRVDHYSFTFPNQPISSIPYFFQVVLSLFVSAFGSPEGFQLLRMFSFCLFMLAVYFYYREIKAPWQIIFITLPYIFIFLLFRFNHIRAEIFDNLLIIVALILYLKASKAFTHRNLAYIAVLQLLWVNYHVPILGYVIFFGLFLDKAIDIIARKDTAISWQLWVFWGFIIFAVGFMHPGFTHPLVAALNFSSEWSFIAELKPTNEIAPNSSLFYALWLVSGYIAISLVLQRQYGLALVCCIFAFNSWQAIHVITISGVIVTSLLALTLTRVNFDDLFKSIKPGIRILVLSLAAGVAISGILHSASKAMDIHGMDNSHDLPADVVVYLKKNHPGGGHIFNRLRDGGYLLYHLSPQFKVYIDGRTNILYPIEFTKRFVALYGSRDFKPVSDEIDRYNIEFAIYPLKLALSALTTSAHPMSVEYVSKEFFLFSNGENNFPLSSRILFFPMCWKEPNQQELAAERATGNKILPADSVLLPLLETMVELNNGVNADEVFNSTSSHASASNYHKRLLGYAALDLEDYEHAFEFFGSIAENDTLDLLMLAYAALKNRNYRATEEILQISLSNAWSELTARNLNSDEQAIAITLLEALQTQQVLSSQLEAQLAQMKQSLLQDRPSLELPLANVIPKAHCATIFSTLSATKN